jgi:hypothetical protein
VARRNIGADKNKGARKTGRMRKIVGDIVRNTDVVVFLEPRFLDGEKKWMVCLREDCQLIDFGQN